MSRKYVVVISGMVIQACLGGIYAWGVFVPALRETYHLSTAQTQAIFGTAIAAWALAMIPAGRGLSRLGPRLTAGLAGLLFLCGSGLAAVSNGNFWLLWAGIGGLNGSAIGCGYVCVLTLITQWFPMRRGLGAGLGVGSFGAGAILEASLAEWLLQAGRGVLSVLGWIGVVYGVLIGLSALGLSVPDGQTCRRPGTVTPLRGLLADRRFRLAVLGIFSGTFAGLLVIGNLKSIGLAGGLSPAVCAVAVSLFAIGNAGGRIAWGWISDWAGDRTIPASLLMLATLVLLVYPASFAGPLFVTLCALVGFGYGACFVLYAAYISRQYRDDLFSAIYPLVFLAFGLSGTVGPVVGGWLYDASRSYLTATLTAACVTLAGAAGTWSVLASRQSVAERQPAGDPAAAGN